MSRCKPYGALRRRALVAAFALGCLLAAHAASARQVDADAPATASDAAPAPGPRTGDGWVDARVEDIGRYGARYRPALADELVRYHGAPRALVDALLDRPGWTPGDAYFACALAYVSGRPCSDVVARRTRAADGGWETVAAALDAAPGSPAFLRLKRGIADSYARWNRPLSPDAELARDLRRNPSATARKAATPR